MLRMYLLQMWFNLSDEGVEDAIYDSFAMRKFMGINFCEEQVLDATTLLKFRHILEKHKLGQVLFNAVRDGLEKSGHIMHGDSGYIGIVERSEIQADRQKAAIEYRINRRPKKILKMTDSPEKDWERHIEKRKSSVRCKVEHTFRIVKGIFGYRKVTYRGLAKNFNRFYMLFGSANLLMCAWAGRKLYLQ